MRRSTSKSSLVTTETETKGAVSPVPSSLTLVPDSAAATDSVFSPLPHVKAVNAAFMERTPFAIDDAGDDDDEDDEDEGYGVGHADDDAVMDEVDAFLEAHDSGLSKEDKDLANDLVNASPMR